MLTGYVVFVRVYSYRGFLQNLVLGGHEGRREGWARICRLSSGSGKKTHWLLKTRGHFNRRAFRSACCSVAYGHTRALVLGVERTKGEN